MTNLGERTSCVGRILLNGLPDLEGDEGGTMESVKRTRNDMDSLALEYLPENVPPTGRAGSFFVDGFLKITKIRSVFFQSPSADH